MPTKSKRHVHQFKLTDFKNKKADEGSIEIETDDADIFTIAPPELWSDDITLLAQAEDNIGAARLLIGEDRYPAFVAAGGNAMLVMSIIREAHGIPVGESPASSSS